jgi:hypothetical protein
MGYGKLGGVIGTKGHWETYRLACFYYRAITLFFLLFWKDNEEFFEISYDGDFHGMETGMEIGDETLHFYYYNNFYDSIFNIFLGLLVLCLLRVDRMEGGC